MILIFNNNKTKQNQPNKIFYNCTFFRILTITTFLFASTGVTEICVEDWWNSHEEKLLEAVTTASVY